MNRSNLVCLAGVLFLTACGDEPPSTSPEPASSHPPNESATPTSDSQASRHLEQGWNSATREVFHHSGFGSELMAVDLFAHLEQPDVSTPFRDPTYLAQFGLLESSYPGEDREGWPIGFAAAGDQIGLTCAACHSGAIDYQGQRVVIDGAPALFDFAGFEGALVDALAATIADPDKRDRLAAARKMSSNAVLNELTRLHERLDTRHQLNESPVAYGHGRMDAFGQIFNAIAVTALNIPGNRHVPNAPVSYPALWDAPHLDVVQWNGSAPNAAVGPLIQNVTTALAVYGHVDMLSDSDLPGYASGVDFANLGHLQDALYELQSPQWPQELLGSIDQNLAAKGKDIYAENCRQCHALVDRDDRHRKLKATLTPVSEVGTDPQMVKNFLKDDVDPGPLTGKKVAGLAGDEMSNPASAIDIVVHAAIGATLRHPIESTRAAAEGYHKVFKAALDQHPDYYKARPLSGIWATAPYLHNGSVPNLVELLKPPAERMSQFHVGNHEYDPANIGYQTQPGPHTSSFDTRRVGNHNIGHSYGTDLSADQKRALLEYLKEL